MLKKYILNLFWYCNLRTIIHNVLQKREPVLIKSKSKEFQMLHLDRFKIKCVFFNFENTWDGFWIVHICVFWLLQYYHPTSPKGKFFMHYWFLQKLPNTKILENWTAFKSMFIFTRLVINFVFFFNSQLHFQ